MPLTIISLVGEQPMPTLIPARQYGAKKLHLIVSPRTEQVGRNIAYALNDPSVEVLFQRTDAYDLEPTRKTIRDVIRRYRRQDHEVWINFTGGTKLMSIAAFLAAREDEATAIYVDTERGRIARYVPGGSEEFEAIQARFDVRCYLTAHGLEVEGIEEPASEWREKAEYVAKNMPAGLEVLRAVGSSQGQDRRYRPVSPLGVPQRAFARNLERMGLLDVREEQNGLQVRSKHPPQIRKFLTGGWLETYTAHALRESRLFDDVCQNVRVIKGVDGEQIRNELDVVAACKGRLLVCSCKTSQKDMEDNQNNRGALYELDALARRENIGIYCSKALITSQVALKQSLIERAQSSSIALIDGRQLSQLPQLLAKRLGVYR